jgi:hypothetical protein
MKAHGGTLEAESEGSGQGAKFTARFKIDDESASDFTAQDPLQRKSSPAPSATNGATPINSTNLKL